ncbi:MAG: hypothetical protein HC767_11970 [Akkermansiaceae bacterium]|nr:hypothetical protein [Akkermansiaceae bacterium]
MSCNAMERRLLRESVMRLDSVRNQISKVTQASLDVMNSRLNELRTLHKTHHPARMLERRTEALETLRRQIERAGKMLLLGGINASPI